MSWVIVYAEVFMWVVLFLFAWAMVASGKEGKQ